MYLSSEEIALALQMNGSTEELLVQEHLAEARSTLNFLEQVSSCREILNILYWKFASYSKNYSASYKHLCSILHNATKFKGETPIYEGKLDLVKTRTIAKQKSIKRLQYTTGKKRPSTVKSVKTLKKKPMKNKRGTRSIKPVKNSVDTVIEEVVMGYVE